MFYFCIKKDNLYNLKSIEHKVWLGMEKYIDKEH